MHETDAQGRSRDPNDVADSDAVPGSQPAGRVRPLRGSVVGPFATALVAIACIWAMVQAITVGIPPLSPGRSRQVCARNLADLGKIYVTWRMENPETPPHSGVALLLHFRKKREIPQGAESKLICPGDQHVLYPDTPALQARYDDVDLDDPPEDLCSYAVRDFERFPIEAETWEPEIIACDRCGLDGRTPHHENGLYVMFNDGSARFMDREKLGLGPDEPIVVGPESTHPMLSKVIYRRRE